MAKPTIILIEALRNTAKNLKSGGQYMWGHMGACNCGHLAQELTAFTKAEIHDYAMRGRGDWSEQAEAYCGKTEMSIDIIISELLSKGLTREDLIHLERLSDRDILAHLPHEVRIQLKHNVKADVVLYMETWAKHLEEQLIDKIKIPSLEPKKLVEAQQI